MPPLVGVLIVTDVTPEYVDHKFVLPALIRLYWEVVNILESGNTFQELNLPDCLPK